MIASEIVLFVILYTLHHPHVSIHHTLHTHACRQFTGKQLVYLMHLVLTGDMNHEFD